MAQDTLSVDLSAIAKKAEEIYEAKYRKTYEKRHYGKYLAIDINEGKVYLADFPGEALNKADAANPKGVFHLMRIGFETAFHVRVA